jgi:hypothetical protein
MSFKKGLTLLHYRWNAIHIKCWIIEMIAPYIFTFSIIIVVIVIVGIISILASNTWKWHINAMQYLLKPVQLIYYIFTPSYFFNIMYSCRTYKMVSESSRSVIVVTALVKEDERGGQGHASASLLHQSAMRHRAVEHALFLHECFFNFVFCFVCNRWKNQATCLHQVGISYGRYYRVLTMVYNTQRYWVFGLCPSSGFFLNK